MQNQGFGYNSISIIEEMSKNVVFQTKLCLFPLFVTTNFEMSQDKTFSF